MNKRTHNKRKKAGPDLHGPDAVLDGYLCPVGLGELLHDPHDLGALLLVHEHLPPPLALGFVRPQLPRVEPQAAEPVTLILDERDDADPVLPVPGEPLRLGPPGPRRRILPRAHPRSSMWWKLGKEKGYCFSSGCSSRYFINSL